MPSHANQVCCCPRSARSISFDEFALDPRIRYEIEPKGLLCYRSQKRVAMYRDKIVLSVPGRMIIGNESIYDPRPGLSSFLYVMSRKDDIACSIGKT